MTNVRKTLLLICIYTTSNTLTNTYLTIICSHYMFLYVTLDHKTSHMGQIKKKKII